MHVKDGIARYGDQYYVVLREKDPVTGKAKTVYHSGFATRDAAKAFRDKRRNDLRTMKVRPKSGLKLSEYLEEWLPRHCTTKQLKPSTQEAYREQVYGYLIPKLGHLKLQEITPVDIENFYAEMLTSGGKSGNPLSARTVEFSATILRLALKKAVTVYKLIPSSPAADVDVPRPRAQAKDTWTAQEMASILKASSNHRLGALFVLAAATGARRGELLALRWANVDSKARTVRFVANRVGLRRSVEEGSLKNDQEKTVTIDSATVAILLTHRKRQAQERLACPDWQEGDYVFATAYGLPVHPRNLHRVWKEIVAIAGVKYLKPHAMRHTHATLLLEAGVPLHVVAKRLGHKDAMVTATVYAQVTPRQEDEAAVTYESWLAGDSDTQRSDSAR